EIYQHYGIAGAARGENNTGGETHAPTAETADSAGSAAAVAGAASAGAAGAPARGAAARVGVSGTTSSVETPHNAGSKGTEPCDDKALNGKEEQLNGSTERV